MSSERLWRCRDWKVRANPGSNRHNPNPRHAPGAGVDRRSGVTKKPHRRCKGMNRPWLVAALLVSGCASASPATQGSSPTPTQATATPVAQRFVDVPPAVTKLASAYGDPWAQVVAFHEVGLLPVERGSSTVRGTAAVNYALDTAHGVDQVSTRC